MEKIVQEIQTACVASTKSNVGKQSEKNDAFMEQHRKDKIHTKEIGIFL